MKTVKLELLRCISIPSLAIYSLGVLGVLISIRSRYGNIYFVIFETGKMQTRNRYTKTKLKFKLMGSNLLPCPVL